MVSPARVTANRRRSTAIRVSSLRSTSTRSPTGACVNAATCAIAAAMRWLCVRRRSSGRLAVSGKSVSPFEQFDGTSDDQERIVDFVHDTRQQPCGGDGAAQRDKRLGCTVPRKVRRARPCRRLLVCGSSCAAICLSVTSVGVQQHAGSVDDADCRRACAPGNLACKGVRRQDRRAKVGRMALHRRRDRRRPRSAHRFRAPKLLEPSPDRCPAGCLAPAFELQAAASAVARRVDHVHGVRRRSPRVDDSRSQRRDAHVVGGGAAPVHAQGPPLSAALSRGVQRCVGRHHGPDGRTRLEHSRRQPGRTQRSYRSLQRH